MVGSNDFIWWWNQKEIMKGICSIFFPQVFLSSWDFFNPAMFRGHSLKAIRLGVQNSSRSIIKKTTYCIFFSPSCIIFYFLYLAITVEKQQDFIAIVNTITDQKSSHIFGQHMLSSVQSESWIFRGEWQFFSYRSLIFCCWLHVLCGTVAYLISYLHYDLIQYSQNSTWYSVQQILFVSSIK